MWLITLTNLKNEYHNILPKSFFYKGFSFFKKLEKIAHYFSNITMQFDISQKKERTMTEKGKLKRRIKGLNN